MADQNNGAGATQLDAAAASQRAPYVTPEVRRLGTLAELTAGGSTGLSDGFGQAGGTGSVP